MFQKLDRLTQLSAAMGAPVVVERRPDTAKILGKLREFDGAVSMGLDEENLYIFVDDDSYEVRQMVRIVEAVSPLMRGFNLGILVLPVSSRQACLDGNLSFHGAVSR